MLCAGLGMPRMELSFDDVKAQTNLPPSFLCLWRDGRYGSVWVDVVGELDLDASVRLMHVLDEAQSRSNLVVLDMRALTFVDLSGVRVIVAAAARARRDGHGLLVARGPIHVDVVFTLTGTREHVELFDLDPALHPPVLGEGLPDPRHKREAARRQWRDGYPRQSRPAPRREGVRRESALRLLP
jgi:anti-sigma B factor antagonist